MPCNCSGVNYFRCKCVDKYPSILQERGRSGHRTLLFAKNKSNFTFRCKELIKQRKTNYVTMLVKALYERCAAYNLRYCPFEGITGRCYHHTVARDMVVLFCFLVANLIVLASIFFRILIHFIYFSLQIGGWINRFYKKKYSPTTTVKKLSTDRSAYSNDATKVYDYYS